MKKNIKISVKSDEYDEEIITNGLLKDNKVVYIDNNKVINCFDFNRQILTRKNKNDNTKTQIFFDKMPHCHIYYNEREYIDQQITIKSKIHNDNLFEVEYTIYENQSVIYKIEIIN